MREFPFVLTCLKRSVIPSHTREVLTKRSRNCLNCSVSFILGFSTPFGVPRVVFGGHFRLLAPWVTRLRSQWMLHWWRVNASTARELFPCTHQPINAKHYRLGRPQVRFFKSSVWPDQESNPVFQFGGLCSVIWRPFSRFEKDLSALVSKVTSALNWKDLNALVSKVAYVADCKICNSCICTAIFQWHTDIYVLLLFVFQNIKKSKTMQLEEK